MRICPSCKLDHPGWEVCKMAAARIARERSLIDSMKAQGKAAAGTEKLPEGTGLAGVKTREPVPVAAPKKVVKKVLGVGRPRVYPDPEARRKERQRQYMKAYRARKK